MKKRDVFPAEKSNLPGETPGKWDFFSVYNNKNTNESSSGNRLHTTYLVCWQSRIDNSPAIQSAGLFSRRIGCRPSGGLVRVPAAVLGLQRGFSGGKGRVFRGNRSDSAPKGIVPF